MGNLQLNSNSSFALKVENLSFSFGDSQILHNVDLNITRGRITCLVGNNGTGKSTLLRLVSGILTPESGTVKLGDTDITNYSVKERIKQGVGYLMQDNAVFPRLSVLDNLRLAALSGTPETLDEAKTTLDNFFNTSFVSEKKAGMLSGGERRVLGLGMLIAQGSDRLWLLDEPSAGVAPNLVNQIMKFLQNIRRNKGLCILMVEQNLKAGLNACDEAAILKGGQISVHRSPEQLLNLSNIETILF